MADDGVMHEVEDVAGAYESARHRDADEIRAAIDMVLCGAALRVRLVNLAEPLAAAGAGAADAAAAGVQFRVDDATDHVEIIVGPRR